MKYLIYAKYKEDSDYKFLNGVAKDKAEAIRLLEEYPNYGMIGEMIPISQMFKDCHSLEQKICKILRELQVDEDSFTKNCKHFSIELFGDWKHVHAHCNNIITKLFNCNLIREDVTYEDGSDCYGAIHTYCL